MKSRLLIAILPILILFGIESYGQSDSLRYFSIEQIRLIDKALISKESCELSLHNYELWTASLAKQNSILKVQTSSDYKKIQTLTESLNDEVFKRKKARRSRVTWGIVGALIGAITYGILQ